MDLLGAALFLLAGLWVLRTRRAGDRARAFQMFGLFWVGAGVGMATDALLTGLGLALPALPQGLALPILEVKVLATLAAVAGVVHYLLFIYTGRPVLVQAVALGFVLVITLAEVTIAQSGPLGLETDTWRVWYDFREPPRGPTFLLTVALAFAPPLLLCAAYGRLVLLLHDRAARWRGAWLTLGLTGFFVAYALAALFASQDAVVLLQKALNLGAGVAAALALRPPAWARERFGARPLEAGA